MGDVGLGRVRESIEWLIGLVLRGIKECNVLVYSLLFSSLLFSSLLCEDASWSHNE